MRFSLFKKITCILGLFILLQENAHTSKHQLFEDEQTSQQECPLTHPDVAPQIYSLLDENDHHTISFVCKAWHCATDFYYQSVLEPFLRNPFEDAPDTPNIFSKTFLKKALQQRIRHQGFVVIPHRSILISYLHNNFHPLNAQDLQRNLKASERLYAALFNEPLTLNEESIPTNLQHLLAALPVTGIFLDQGQRELGSINFFECFSEALETKLKEMAKARPYWSFSSAISPDLKGKLKTTPHVLVITDNELSIPHNKEILQGLLSRLFTSALTETKTNQYLSRSHAILLDVSLSSFVQNGVLRLFQDSLPTATSELILTNHTGTVFSLGDGFLKEMPCLQILNLHSFLNLTEIGNDALKSNWFLRVFRIAGMPNLTHIKNNFLYDCQRLPELDISPFKEVISIGDSFIKNCTVFHKINIENLESITHIGPWSLENTLLDQEQKREIQEYFKTRKITWQG